MPSHQVGTEVSAHIGTIKNSNGALLKKAYQISHSKIHIWHNCLFFHHYRLVVGDIVDIKSTKTNKNTYTYTYTSSTYTYTYKRVIFSLFLPLFGHCRATFGAFWVLQMAQIGLSRRLLLWTILVPPILTSKLALRADLCGKRLFLAYFCPF